MNQHLRVKKFKNRSNFALGIKIAFAAFYSLGNNEQGGVKNGPEGVRMA